MKPAIIRFFSNAAGGDRPKVEDFLLEVPTQDVREAWPSPKPDMEMLKDEWNAVNKAWELLRSQTQEYESSQLPSGLWNALNNFHEWLEGLKAYGTQDKIERDHTDFLNVGLASLFWMANGEAGDEAPKIANKTAFISINDFVIPIRSFVEHIISEDARNGMEGAHLRQEEKKMILQSFPQILDR